MVEVTVSRQEVADTVKRRVDLLQACFGLADRIFTEARIDNQAVRGGQRSRLRPDQRHRTEMRLTGNSAVDFQRQLSVLQDCPLILHRSPRSFGPLPVNLANPRPVFRRLSAAEGYDELAVGKERAFS